MLRFPCEYFLRHLQIEGCSLADAARLYGYPVPEPEYIDFIKARVEEDRPVPCTQGTAEMDHWLRDQRVYAFYERPRPEALNAAFRVLGDPCLRPILEVLLLTALPMPTIAQYFEAATGVPTGLEDVRTYAHFFWNRRVMSLAQWRAFLVATEYPDFRNLLLVLATPPEVALWQLGFRLSLDRTKAIRTIFDNMIVRTFESLATPAGRNNAETVRAYSDIALRAAVYLDGTEDAADKQIQVVKTLSMKRDGSKVAGLLEATGGQHTDAKVLTFRGKGVDE